jgi:hypothetical protein
MSDLPPSVFYLPERRSQATQSIQSWAVLHCSIDFGIGLLGWYPLPGAATASLVASLGAGIPIYQGLARDLSAIYEAPNDDVIANRLLTAGMVQHAASTVAVEVVGQFGPDFLADIASDIIHELGLGFVVGTFVPILGPLLASGLDVAVAATMTWRVGIMIVGYYENGRRFPGGSREKAYEGSKRMTGGLSPTINGRCDLADIPSTFPEVGSWQAKRVAEEVLTILHYAPKTPFSTIRQDLLKKGIKAEIADEALKIAAEKLAQRAKDQ